MSKMDDFEKLSSGDLFKLLEQTYYHEHDKKNQLSSKANTPLGIFYLVIGGLVYYLNSIVNFHISFWSICFFILLFLLIICVVKTAFYFFRLFSGQIYGHVPLASDSQEYFEDLKEFYKQTEREYEGAAKAIKKDVEEYIKDILTTATTQSQKANEVRSNIINKIHAALGLSAVFVALTIIPFKFYQFENDEIKQKRSILSSQKKEIEQTKKYNIMERKMSEQVKTEANKSKPSQPKKPTPPKVRMIRDGFSNKVDQKDSTGGKSDK